MRKLKLQMQITLDGFVGGPEGQNDWVFASGPDPVGFQKIIELAETSDTLLIGRKMAPEFIEHWENMVNNQPDSPQRVLAQLIVNMRKFVFSHALTTLKGRNVQVESGDLVTAVQALKNEPGKDILVYGGANFVSSLISHNLIDEYFIILNPIAIGKGLSIFMERKMLKYESSIVFKNGKVLVKYTC
jgi:dihydrofolate reductase